MPSERVKKKTFCAGLSQKVLIRRPLGAPLVGRITVLRVIVLTAAPDPEVIYSPLSKCTINIWHGGSNCQGTGVWGLSHRTCVGHPDVPRYCLSVPSQRSSDTPQPAYVRLPRPACRVSC
jgi:hypothetical protein